MANSLLDTIRSKRNGAMSDIENTIENQMDNLRGEIAELTKLISKNGASQSKRIRAQAESGYEDLLARSEDLMHQLQDGYARSAKEVRATVRAHPTTSIGAVAAIGLLFVLLARR
ncbi:MULTISPECIES: DUF883 family protein [unclassified Rhizobium]|uniref:DUF883 family protein n=1 Tax=unclassified Rhizobium TaxID=2613769 RepID=UPI001ADAFBC5|nr:MULTISPECIES: DUF883 family protein [unclassified Rhizobium]MBO9099190.1 DUF883 family protein [Rhizobium sp. L58/93]MBO9132004.1 DUF883 family protein [Rhizobium sp. B209b/85]MBO9169452.1 DUF883 family protein [Rhizobium sp. L245/93]MBO9185403.1 DUF883 family protein [Rhizobium sp. E27B/91]QXZ85540.1 DUF883 family protein [Rhizobium sp. K1/93]